MDTMDLLEPKRLRRLRRLGTVPRWTVVPTIKTQNVGEHSFHVAYMALWVARLHARLHDGSADLDILGFAIVHDETEAITGDIPASENGRNLSGKSKVMENKYKLGDCTASNDIKSVLKLADLLEAYLFVQEEKRLGNRALFDIEQDVKRRIFEAASRFEFGRDCPAMATDPDILVSAFFKCFDPTLHPVMEKL